MAESDHGNSITPEAKAARIRHVFLIGERFECENCGSGHSDMVVRISETEEWTRILCSICGKASDYHTDSLLRFLERRVDERKWAHKLSSES